MHNQIDEPFGFGASEPHATGAMREPDEIYESFQSRHPYSPARSSAPTPPCPKCQSGRIETRNHARKAAGAIGTLAGTTSSIAVALSGAEFGAKGGVISGPVGSVCGGIAGAIIAGLVGGAVGCAAGAVLGEVFDEKVLNNYRCQACGHTFSWKQP